MPRSHDLMNYQKCEIKVKLVSLSSTGLYGRDRCRLNRGAGLILGVKPNCSRLVNVGNSRTGGLRDSVAARR